MIQICFQQTSIFDKLLNLGVVRDYCNKDLLHVKNILSTIIIVTSYCSVL